MSQKPATNIIQQFRLDGKVSLVTGASRGIGLAMAEGLAGAGSELVIVGRELETLTRSLSELLRRPVAPSFPFRQMSEILLKLTRSLIGLLNFRQNRCACQQRWGQ